MLYLVFFLRDFLRLSNQELSKPVHFKGTFNERM